MLQGADVLALGFHVRCLEAPIRAATLPALRPLSPTVQRQLDSKRTRVEELAAEWGVGCQLAAALCLSQPYLPAGAVDRTGRLLAVLQVRWGWGVGDQNSLRTRTPKQSLPWGVSGLRPTPCLPVLPLCRARWG